jgi:hypothetical protein
MDTVFDETTMFFECASCEGKVPLMVVGSYSHTLEQYAGETFTYILAKCPKCSSPFLIMEQTSMWGAPPVCLYPPDEYILGHLVPDHIKHAYKEAVACLKAGSYTATALMCRRALEGVCVQLGASEKSLAASLKKLEAKGIIDGTLAKWAHALRDFGNDAAHDFNVVTSPQDAHDLLDFTQALLEQVYTFRTRLEALLHRRAKAKSGSF